MNTEQAELIIKEQAPERVFIREVTVRYSRRRHSLFAIYDPKSVSDFARLVIKDNSREHFIALFLDGSHRVASYSVVAIGSANFCNVHPREVFQHALLAGAVALAVAHNHPSGNLEPSEADRNVTKLLVQVGEVIGIKVLDHVIFTDENFVSFKEHFWL